MAEDDDDIPGLTSAMETMFDHDKVYSVSTTQRTERVELRPAPPRPSSEPSITVTICIRESSFPNAGLGVFAEEDIPGGYGAEYAGRWVPKAQDSRSGVSEYRWTVFAFDETTGKVLGSPEIGEKEVIGFIDAGQEASGNWCRFINSALAPHSANIFQWQEFNKSYYGTLRPIAKGEELATWYGPAFARALGLRAPEFPE